MVNKEFYLRKIRVFWSKTLSLQRELNEFLGLNITKLRIINVYDIFNIDEDLLNRAKENIFAKEQQTIYIMN